MRRPLQCNGAAPGLPWDGLCCSLDERRVFLLNPLALGVLAILAHLGAQAVAKASGIPCVVTDIGDSAELVGDAGIVVQPRDPEALADGWIKILRLSGHERKEMGERGRSRIRSEYALSTIVKRYENLYLQTASKTDRLA